MLDKPAWSISPPPAMKRFTVLITIGATIPTIELALDSLTDVVDEIALTTPVAVSPPSSEPTICLPLPTKESFLELAIKPEKLSKMVSSCLLTASNKDAAPSSEDALFIRPPNTAGIAPSIADLVASGVSPTALLI